jgi:hypothetical protein
MMECRRKAASPEGLLDLTPIFHPSTIPVFPFKPASYLSAAPYWIEWPNKISRGCATQVQELVPPGAMVMRGVTRWTIYRQSALLGKQTSGTGDWFFALTQGHPRGASRYNAPRVVRNMRQRRERRPGARQRNFSGRGIVDGELIGSVVVCHGLLGKQVTRQRHFGIAY